MSDNEKTVILVFGFLTLLAIINWFILVIIKIARGFFWLSLVGLILSIFSLIYFVISYFMGEENWWDLDDELGLVVLLSVGAIIIFYLFAGACYNAGYSPEAIKNEVNAKAYLESYSVIVNLPDQIIEDTINNSCKDPSYPCDQVKQTYQMYRSFVWWKDSADAFSKILITAKKVDKTINS